MQTGHFFYFIVLDGTVTEGLLWNGLVLIPLTELEVLWRMPTILLTDELILMRMKRLLMTHLVVPTFCGWQPTSLVILWDWLTLMSVVLSCTPTIQAMYQICSFILTTLQGYSTYTVSTKRF